MYYGHSRNRGHGRRTPAYEWVPSFSPSSRRRRQRSTSTGFGPSRKARAPRSRSWDSKPNHMRYPKLSLVPSSLGEGLVQILGGTVLAVVWMYWEFFLAAGIAAFVLRLLARRCGSFEKSCTINCEKEYNSIRTNRKISVNTPPSAETVLAAWKATRGARRGDPDALAARLRLGAMLSDLEPAVDQSYVRDERGTIVGRRPGLRGWIAWNCPGLLPHYKALMAYKALADKLRLALRIQEPDTLDSVLELEPGCQGGSPKSMQLKSGIKLLKSNVKEVIQSHTEMFQGWMPGTMAALEAAVRERLGLAWMRRGRQSCNAA